MLRRVAAGSLDSAGAQAAAWLVTRAVNGAIGLVHVALVIAAVGADVGGRFFVIWTGAWVVSTLARFGVDLVLPRAVAEARAGGERPLSAHRAMLAGGVLGAVSCVPVLAALQVSLTATTIVSSAVIVAAWVMTLDLAGLLQAHGRVPQHGLVMNVLWPMPSVLAAVIALGVDGGLDVLLVCTAVAALAGSLGAFIVVRSSLGRKPGASLIGRDRPVLAVDRDLVAAAAVGLLWQTVIWLPVLLGAVVGVAPVTAAGLFAATRIAGACSWPYAAVVAAATPRLAQAIAQRDAAQTRTLLVGAARRGLVVSLVPVGIAIAAAGPLVRLFDERLDLAAGVLVALAAARLFDALTGPLSEALVVGRRAQIEVAATTAGVLAGGLAAVALYPSEGVIAIGLGTAAASVLANTIRLVVWRRMLGAPRGRAAAARPQSHRPPGWVVRWAPPGVAAAAAGGAVLLGALDGGQALVWPLTALAVIVALSVAAFVCGSGDRWAVGTSPLAVAAVLLVTHFTLRPAAIVADPGAALWGLRMIGVQWNAVCDAVTIGVAGFGALAAAFMVGWNVVRAAPAPQPSTPLPSRHRLLVAAGAALAAGTLMWLALFLEVGGLPALLDDPTAVHLGQQGEPYGVIGLSICLGAMLLLLLAWLRDPSRATTVLLALAAVSSVAGSVALATRGQLLGGLVAATFLVARERRPGRRTVAAGLVLLAVAGGSLMTLRAIRGNSDRHSLGTAVRATIDEGPWRIAGAEFTEFDALVALRELNPSALGPLRGQSIREVATAGVPRRLWERKPKPVDLLVSGTLYGPGTVAGTPFTLPGEFWWNVGLVPMLAWMAALGLLAGALWRRAAARHGAVARVGLAILAGYAYLLFTRPLAPMTLNVVVALAAPLAIWAAAHARRPQLRIRRSSSRGATAGRRAVTGHGREFGAGDALRGLAAVAVLNFHAAAFAVIIATGVTIPGPVALRAELSLPGMLAAQLGSIGLFTFFVLSGYLLGRPFVDWWINGGSRPATGAYVVRRLLRIWPAFAVVVACAAMLFGDARASVGDVLAVLAFVQIYHPSDFGALLGQAWTLDVEMAFYLALPAVALLVAPRRARLARRARIAVVVVGSFAAFAGSTYLSYLAATGRVQGPADLELALTPIGAGFGFMPGIVLAALDVTGRLQLRGPAHLLRLMAWTLVVIGLALGGIAQTDLLPGSLPWVAQGLGPGCIVAGALLWQRTFGATLPGLRSRPLHWLGERSYGVYLWHLIALALWQPVVLDAPVGLAYVQLLVFGLVFSLIAGHLSFRCVEQPLIRWGRRRWRRAPAPPARVTGEPAVSAA